MDDRMTIANMAIEAGGKNAIFEFDSRTQEYVDARVKLNGTKSSYTPVDATGPESLFTNWWWILSKLEPTVACHPDPGQRKKAKDMGHIKLDRAYVGSCTGGKTSDFVEFARVLRGHKWRLTRSACRRRRRSCAICRRLTGATDRLDILVAPACR
jgi:3-isopropylmalate/(R)-2-methylmalate dehydratase large subunit